MRYKETFDVIVVGGGHAGTEAALASARMSAKTLLLTHSIETIGVMSCNPSIGGIGKSHLVAELDALGGVMGRAADFSGIHVRILNASKGPAVQATRAQADRQLYRAAIRSFVEEQENLCVFQQAVDDLIISSAGVEGVITQGGIHFFAKTVILTTGTFLAGKIHVGDQSYTAGRAGDPPALKLAEKLRDLPFRVARLKTGTPPRIDGRTIDYDKMQIQLGDDPLPYFSEMFPPENRPKQLPCYITQTTAQTRTIIKESLHRSPLYSGKIEGRGPRYCPSIEDKIVRFEKKESHQIFIEPEGLYTQEIYPNGISTSLPFDVQQEIVHSIVGLEQAHITRPGYAIEYDFLDPRDLKPSLESKLLARIFFAGQINGTTGYEEAAAQGIVAGINAALLAQEKAPWHPARSDSYLGVMIDDLTTLGAPEPYRMFTSRSEYRLRLREDNACVRLTPIGFNLGVVKETQWKRFENKERLFNAEKQRLGALLIRPTTNAALKLQQLTQTILEREYRAADLLTRPEISYAQLKDLPDCGDFIEDKHVTQRLENAYKYAGYIERQEKEIERLKRFEKVILNASLNYADIPSLSAEVQEKLNGVKPHTLGQASRIPGVTPAALSQLLIYLKKRGMLSEFQA